MIQRSKQRKIKYWLNTILKVLLITIAVIKLFDWKPWEGNGEDNIKHDTDKETSSPDVSGPEEGETLSLTTNQKTANNTSIKKESIIPNSASIYIFSDNGLDTSISNQLGKTYFEGYSLKSEPGYDKSQLLSGNLGSAANTELICVGTVSYAYYQNSLGQTTCEIDISFDTYNNTLGTKLLEFSVSRPFSGPGETNARAKANAIKKIHP